MSYYSKPPARFAGMDPMDMAKAAAIEREERRERMEQAEKDLKTVQHYLSRVESMLREQENSPHVGTAVQGIFWAQSVNSAICKLAGKGPEIIASGLTLADAARDAALERSESDEDRHADEG